MNLTPLYDLKERLEASVIAGTALMQEDFRLSRAVEQMEPLAKVSPILAKIIRSAQALVSPKGARKGEALLDVLALVDAVLVTQAAVDVEGELTGMLEGAKGAQPAGRILDGAAEGHVSENAAESRVSEGATESRVSEGAVKSSYREVPYRVLAPLLEALTATGSGHYSLLLETYAKDPGIFEDYRLKPALVAGLNSSYAQQAEHIEQWLCQGDASVVPMLKQAFDPKGKKEMARRVHVIEAVCGAAENDWYLSQLPEAHREIRCALICALRHSPQNLETLLTLAKTEKGNSKKAAFWALSRMEDLRSLPFWRDQLKRKPLQAAPYLAFSQKDEISDLIAEEIEAILDRLFMEQQEGSSWMSAQDFQALQALFAAMMRKASTALQSIYHRLAAEPLLEQFRLEKNEPIQFADNDTYEDGVRLPAAHAIAGILLDSILWTMDARLLSLAGELYQMYGRFFLRPAFAAALLTKPKGEVYQAFSGFLRREDVSAKETEAQKLARMELMSVFARIRWEPQGYVCVACQYDEYADQNQFVHRPLYEAPDLRWFKLLTNHKLKKSGAFWTYRKDSYGGEYVYQDDWDLALSGLICSQDEENCGILGQYFERRARQSNSANAARRYYPLLKRCHVQNGRGLVVQLLLHNPSALWELECMIQEAPMTTEEKLAELQEIKTLVEEEKIKLSGWNEQRFEQICTRTEKEGSES